MAKSERIIFPDLGAMSHEAAQYFVRAAREAISERGRFLAALSGGRTSRHTYELLAGSYYGDQIAWEKVHLFLSDERFVPVSDPESNFGTIQKLLLLGTDLPQANQHPFIVEAKTLEEAARKSEEIFRGFLGETEAFPRFDLIFLGMGDDGHVAGLFPGTEAFREKASLVTFSKKTGGFDRLSLTLPLMNAARQIIFLVAGEEKAQMVARVLEGGGSSLPAASLSPREGEISWFLDQAAASLLESP